MSTQLIVALVAIAVLVGLAVKFRWLQKTGEAWTKSRAFLRETRSEVKKVTFPSRDEVIGTTVVVIIASFIFAIYLWMADLVILKVYEGVYRVFGT